MPLNTHSFIHLLQLGNYADVWIWLEETAIPNLYPTTMYNKRYRSRQERRFINNMHGFRLGPVFLRQLRVKHSTISNHVMLLLLTAAVVIITTSLNIT